MRRALIVAFVLAACVPAAERETAVVDRTKEAIQGGSSDTTHTFVVSVLDPVETCSGTLIAPNLVLTARHCVSRDSGGNFVDCASDAFTDLRSASRYRVSTATMPTFDESPYGVTKILTPAATPFCGNDIALLVLDSAIPSTEAKPATPALDSNAAEYGETLTAIGFGADAPGGTSDDERRRRDGIPIVCLPGKGACDPSDFEMTAAELAAGDGLCEGDSGSGAFVSTTLGTAPEVFGVLSRASDDGSKCTDAVYTRTDAFAQFLIDGALEAAKAGGYPAPSWAAPPGDEDAAAHADARNGAPDEDAPADEDGGAQGVADPPPVAADDGCSIGRHAPAKDASGLAAVFGLALVLGVRRRSCTSVVS